MNRTLSLAIVIASGCDVSGPPQEPAPGTSATLTAAAPRCAPVCEDPEQGKDSYVAIGIMPAPFALDWSSPYKLLISTLASTTIGRSLRDKDNADKPHDIGHVMLKFQCTGDERPTYLSQTGAGPPRSAAALLTKANALLTTFDDGHLDRDAQDDWMKNEGKQLTLGAQGTYAKPPRANALVDLEYQIIGQRADFGDEPWKGIKTAVEQLDGRNAPGRHRFVKAVIKISKAQCDAIKKWREAYTTSKGPSRYAMHRAPWVMNSDGEYDGGACGSVSFAGAFYATGLDYQAAAKTVIVRQEIGTARLSKDHASKDKGDAKVGEYLLQNELRYLTAPVPCARAGGKCKGATAAWTDDLFQKWSGPEDAAEEFSLPWVEPPPPQKVGPVKATTASFVGFEPEKFYQEVLARLKNPDHKAFGHAGWCVPVKKQPAVPTIVLDASVGYTPKPEGLKWPLDKAKIKLVP